MHKQIRTPKGRVKDLESLLSRLAIESERNDGIRTYRVQARRMPDPLFPQDAPVQIFLGAAPRQYIIPTQEMLEVIARNAPGDHGLILDLNTSDENWPRLEVFWNILFDRMKAEGYFDDEEPVLQAQVPAPRNRFLGSRIKYIVATIILSILITAVSLFLFPDWGLTPFAAAALFFVALDKAISILANFRKVTE